MPPFLRKKRSRTGSSLAPEALRYEPNNIALLWMLRILVSLGGQRHFITEHGYQNDELSQILGLPPVNDGIFTDSFDVKTANALLREQYQQCEQRAHHYQLFPTELSHNVMSLARTAQLSTTDCRILEFIALLHVDPLLESCADTLQNLSSANAVQALARILNQPWTAVQASLARDDILHRTGLIRMESNAYQMRSKFEVLSSEMLNILCNELADPISLLRDRIAPSKAPELQWQDYAHISALPLLKSYLSASLASGRKGVNIFLYGPPGTGKTQLTRVLAQESACPAFEITTEDSDGDPVNGRERLNAIRAAQCFLEQTKTLLVFDEAEDIFSGNLFERSAAQEHKGWFNRMLEDNALPMLWLSNNRHGLDPAFVRRFDMVLEIPVPPRQQRLKILRQQCGDMVDELQLQRLAELPQLAPAVVHRAAAVLHIAQAEGSESQSTHMLRNLIDSTLKMQGHRSLAQHSAHSSPTQYDPQHTNADLDLHSLTEGIRKAGEARICLYGPPGTGKSAWALGRVGLPSN